MAARLQSRAAKAGPVPTIAQQSHNSSSLRKICISPDFWIGSPWIIVMGNSHANKPAFLTKLWLQIPSAKDIYFQVFPRPMVAILLAHRISFCRIIPAKPVGRPSNFFCNLLWYILIYNFRKQRKSPEKQQFLSTQKVFCNLCRTETPCFLREKHQNGNHT